MPSISLCISNSELHNYNLSQHTDGIQQRFTQDHQEGAITSAATTSTTHHNALSHKETSPTANIAPNHTGSQYLNPITPVLRPSSPNFSEDIYFAELGEFSLATLPSTVELPGVYVEGNQWATPRYTGHSVSTLDMGDFLGYPMGVSGPDIFGVGSPQKGTGPVGVVDSREHRMEEDIELTGQGTSPAQSSWSHPGLDELQSTHLRRGMMLQLRNFLRIRDYSFTYHLHVTICLQIPLPSVMCPCVTWLH